MNRFNSLRPASRRLPSPNPPLTLRSPCQLLAEREVEVKRLQEQLTEATGAGDATSANQSQSSQSGSSDGDANPSLHGELAQLRQELSDSRSTEEQLRKQIAEKEEKTKKVFMGAKTKINQLNGAKERLSQEVAEAKQSREEQEGRMNALKSQYEGRLLRLDRELRELRESHAHAEPREEPQDQGGAKGGDQTRCADQRQVSLKSPSQDRASSSMSDPPTANIRPTTSTPSPSGKPSPSPGSKATPRASIRPMVTEATVPVPTPTATVMPTTQSDSQEAPMSSGTSVHSTCSGLVTASMNQPTSSQATAFVQPTQQQAANQDAAMEAERPSTSSPLSGTDQSIPNDELSVRSVFCVASQMEGDEDVEGELREEGEPQDSPDDSQVSRQKNRFLPPEQWFSAGLIRDPNGTFSTSQM
ncbi:Nucleoprotein TPR [Liparis tanakae]|uniref:Nucleoprotein TPR n=1 Tax=Liparis tanakae TaxID=230148 RepID=A0A4Z2GU25_9TELE|nr:Nucleoprotein TPR [Liparis tanakae]